MRILQFTDSFLPIVDGVGNVVLQYAENFGIKGNESYVVAPMTDTGYRGNYNFEMIDYIGVTLSAIGKYTVGFPALDSNCVARLNMLKPDIVHVHSPFVAGGAGLNYAKKNKIPLIGTFHSKYYDDFYQVTKSTVAANIGAKAVVDFYRRCDDVWSVSESAAETLRSYGFKGHISVIANGTDILPLMDNAVKTVGTKYFNDDAKALPTLLYVCQINWKKNLKTTLDALSLMKTDARIILAGQGPDEKAVVRYAEKLGIGDKVILTGHISDRNILNALYSLSSLFVFPSVYDTSGLVVREAAAMKTPSVVVAGSSAAECIDDMKNGFICENTPESLAAVIEKALSDKEEMDIIGAVAEETIPIPWSKITDSVLQRYSEVADEYKEKHRKKSKTKTQKAIPGK